MAKLSAFADEVTEGFLDQVKYLQGQRVGYIEPRFIDKKNIMDLSKNELSEAKKMIQDHGLKVSAIGLPIGKVKLDEPFELQMSKAPVSARYIRASEATKIVGHETENQRFETVHHFTASSFWRFLSTVPAITKAALDVGVKCGVEMLNPIFEVFDRFAPQFDLAACPSYSGIPTARCLFRPPEIFETEEIPKRPDNRRPQKQKKGISSGQDNLKDRVEELVRRVRKLEALEETGVPGKGKNWQNLANHPAKRFHVEIDYQGSPVKGQRRWSLLREIFKSFGNRKRM